MLTNERPGVYSSYEVSSAISGSGSGYAVGLCAASANGEKNVCQTVSSYAQAAALFGADSSMTALIKIILLNGAASVRAVAVAEAAGAQDYAVAFDLMKSNEDIKVMVCDSRDADVFAAMKECVLTASENHKYRVGVAELSGAAEVLTASAAALNCERMVLATAVGEVCGGTAAAIAAAISASTDPALPLGGAALYGLSGGDTLSDGEINTLVRGGVIPIENVSGEISIVRAVTTRTSTGGIADTTWRELSTILIVDDVVPTVKSALRSRFARSKNTAQTRGAIRTQVIIELENKLSREIIDSYGAVTVSPGGEDPTICEVSFEFAVAHGLNRIELTAHITV